MSAVYRLFSLDSILRTLIVDTPSLSANCACRMPKAESFLVYPSATMLAVISVEKRNSNYINAFAIENLKRDIILSIIRNFWRID